MLKNRTILLTGITFVAVLANSQTPPSTLPPRQWPKIATARSDPLAVKTFVHRRFYLRGNEYLSTIELPRAPAATEWNSSSQLPLKLAEAEEIARRELRKVVADESKWEVVDFQIARAEVGPNWYIAVTLEPRMQVVTETLPHDSFTALMDLSGRPGRNEKLNQ